CASLKNQSFRWFWIRAWARARSRFALRRLWLSFCLRDRARLQRRISARDCLKNCGLSIVVPSLRVRKVFSPKSIPTILPDVIGLGLSPFSQATHNQRLSNSSRLTVTVLIVPSISRLLLYL